MEKTAKNPLREIALENGGGETLTKLSRLFSSQKINTLKILVKELIGNHSAYWDFHSPIGPQQFPQIRGIWTNEAVCLTQSQVFIKFYEIWLNHTKGGKKSIQSSD